MHVMVADMVPDVFTIIHGGRYLGHRNFYQIHTSLMLEK